MKQFRILGILLLLGTYSQAQAQTAKVTWTTTHQTIDGFGAYDINMTGQFNTSTAVLNQLFTTTGNNVGLSILRVPVPDAGGNTGTDPAGNCSTINTGCGNVTAEESFAAAQGVRIFATPWSPPASMKSNGNYDCGSGGGSGALLSGAYGAYATWLSNFIASKKNAGINLYALSVQNEPDVCPTGYGGALWTATNLDTFIKSDLGPTVTTAGQTSVQIVMPESGGYSVNGGGLHTGMDSYASTCLSDSSCAQYVDICAAHDYEVTHPWTPGPDSLCANAGKRLWETEIYQGSTYDGSMADALIWAQDIHNWMTSANASAWLWWQIFSPYSDNEPLYQPGTTTPSKRLFVIGQWSKFVRPGWVRVDATTEPQSGVFISAFKNSSTGAFAIVAVNTTNGGLSQVFSFSGFPTVTTVTPSLTDSTMNLAAQADVNVSSNSFSYTLPAQSVTTFVGTANGTSGTTPMAPPSGLSATVK